MSRIVHAGAYRATTDNELCTRVLPSDFAVEPWEQDENNLFHVSTEEDLPEFGPERTLEPAASEPMDTTPSPVIEMEPPRFSFYRKPVFNKVPCGEMTLADAYRYITSDEARYATERLRTIGDKAKAKEFKENNFDHVSFGGTFTRCQANALVRASNLIVMDIDDLPNAAAVEDTFNLLLSVPRLETQLLFRSPGGLGLKWVVPIVNNEGHDHRFYFNAVKNYLKTFDIIVDESGKDICRPCFLPFDPNAFIHPKYL